MAKQTKQTANRRPARSQGSAADFTQKRQSPPPKQQAQPVKQKQRELPESNPGELLWKLALIACMGMVIISLLFASINGGSQYVGLPEQETNTNTTPVPPTAVIDPALNVTGSDQTPIPPSPTPAGDAATGDTATGDAANSDTAAVTP